jgi:hypothetical protein
MTTRKLLAAFCGLVSTAVVAVPAFATAAPAPKVKGQNSIKPWVCGPAETPDAASTYVNISNLMCNSLTTTANGVDSAGLTMTNLNNAQNGFGPNSIVFDMWGVANATNGPFVIVTDTSNNIYITDMSTAKKTRTLPKSGVQYNMAFNSFASNDPAPTGSTPISTIAFQINPGTTAFNVGIGGVHLNTSLAKQIKSKPQVFPICPEEN